MSGAAPRSAEVEWATMHFMPDTEEADSAAEKFWPEGYKEVLRREARRAVETRLADRKRFKNVYQKRYTEKFPDLNRFASKIADMIVIGAEKGADDAFDDIIAAFLTEAPLPEERRYTRYLWPQALQPKVKKKLQQTIAEEYRQDEVYRHAFRVGYQNKYRNFEEFIDRVAQLVVTRAMNGADEMLEATYQSFILGGPLPPARRYPRRLKNW